MAYLIYMYENSFHAWSYVLRCLPLLSLNVFFIITWLKNRADRSLFYLFISSLVCLVIMAITPLFPYGVGFSGGETVDTELIRFIIFMTGFIPSIPELVLGGAIFYIGYLKFHSEKTRQNRFLLISGVLWLVFWLTSLLIILFLTDLSILVISGELDSMLHAAITTFVYIPRTLLIYIAALFLSFYGFERTQKHFLKAGILYIGFSMIGYVIGSNLFNIYQLLDIPFF